MILEALITTLNADGSPHLAPMGPEVHDHDFTSFMLKPFNTSQTYRNLKAHGEGVLHVTDDVLLLANAAVGKVGSIPPFHTATAIRGFILNDACRAMEFKVASLDDSQERTRIECEVVCAKTLRGFFGFNRAKHAVLEAAILATRVHLLPHREIEAEFQRLRIIVDKTAGPQELAAMAFLEAWLRDNSKS